ncbi:hypothetical protein V495_00232 [Pseudogymnoascus sp. VKM F-4514 (FW-929)]|nr:hypothetical protein V495_00232 [Pseudogymnoascus sp. VKM F-4514 (FW-929)]KFY67271.1 hypothetical protein V497_00473 [Pseudogymnoascus sp. VKM F-4516 (FW-969)]
MLDVASITNTEMELVAASLRGHDKAVELLLSKGADVNAQGGLYGQALQAASAEGYEKIVEVLLKCGFTLSTARSQVTSHLQDKDRIPEDYGRV